MTKRFTVLLTEEEMRATPFSELAMCYGPYLPYLRRPRVEKRLVARLAALCAEFDVPSPNLLFFYAADSKGPDAVYFRNEQTIVIRRKSPRWMWEWVLNHEFAHHLDHLDGLDLEVSDPDYHSDRFWKRVAEVVSRAPISEARLEAWVRRHY